jgi:hypothetical protein
MDQVLRLVDGPLDADAIDLGEEPSVQVREYFLAVMSDPSALFFTALESGNTEMSVKRKLFYHISNSKTMPYAPRNS